MSLSRRRFLGTTAAALPIAACASADLAAPSPAANLAESTAAPPGPVSVSDLHMGHATDAIRLNKNENPFGPSPRGLEGARAGLEHANRYVNSSILRGHIAAHHGVEPDMIRLGTGSGEVLRALPLAYLRDGGNVVAARQAYRATPGVAESMGRSVKWVDLKPDWSYDIDGMLAAVDDDTRIFYLVNPNNPTGTAIPHTEIERVAQALPERVLLLIDEAYVQFLPEAEATGMSLVQQGRPNVMVTRTFSKVYGLAGLRLGYGVADPAVVEKASTFMMTGPNVAAYGAGIAALGDEAHVRRFVDHARNVRAFYDKELTALGMKFVTGHAPLLLVELGDRVQEAVDALAGQGIFIRHGKSWELPKHVRISFGLEEQNRAVVDALRAFAPG